MMKVLVDHKHQWLLWVFSLWVSVVILAVACGELPQSVVREQAPTEDVQLEEVQPEQKKAAPLSRGQLRIREAYHLLGAPADTVYGPYSKSIPQELKMPTVYRKKAEAGSVKKENPKKKSENDSKKNKNKKKVKKGNQDQKSAQKVVKKQEIDYKEDNLENFGSCIVGDKPTLATIDAKLINNPDVHLNMDAIKQSEIKLDGGSGRFKADMLKTKSDLRKALNLGAGGSGSAIFGLLDVKGSMDYLKNSVFSKESLYYSVNMTINNPDIRMSNVKLSPKAHELYKKRGAEAFFKRCGREAVVGFRSGGQISAIAKFDSSDSQNVTKSALIAAAHASLPSIAKVNLEGNVSQSKKHDFSEVAASLFVAFRGGNPEVIPTTLEDLPNIAKEWGASVREHGLITELITQPYAQMVSNIKEEVIDPEYDMIQKHIIRYVREIDRLENIRDVLLNTSEYKVVDRSLLAKEVNTHLDDLSIRLYKKLEVCRTSRDAATCLDTKLLTEAEGYAPRVKIEHSSCGPLITQQRGRHEDCGKEEYVTGKMLEAHPSCGVERYFSQQIGYRKVDLISSEYRNTSKEPHLPKHYEGGEVWDDARGFIFEDSDYPRVCEEPDDAQKNQRLLRIKWENKKHYTEQGECIEWEEEDCMHRYRPPVFGRIDTIGVLDDCGVTLDTRDMKLLAFQGYQLISPWGSGEVRSFQESSYIPASYSGGMSQADLYSSQQWSSESLKPGAELYQTTRSCARYEKLDRYDWDVRAFYELSCTKEVPEYSSCKEKAFRDKNCLRDVEVKGRFATCPVSLGTYAEELVKKKKKS